MLHAGIGFIVLATVTNLLLLLFRVRAVYGNSMPVTLAFGFLWLVVLVTALMIPFATDAAVSHIIYTPPSLRILTYSM